ncbi:MAG: heme ABC transporter ATP-binding protein [Spirochaetales bacterium]|nr:MAG: heme ABC transporter ATP-binding protein [Spirochaetales bacterium]
MYIEFNGYSFKYYTQKECTLNNIDLSISKGEKVVIVGASGSGKSTIAKCINGLIPNLYRGEVSGTLRIDGKENIDQSVYSLSKKVGTVLQDQDAQFVGLTVGEDIAFALENDMVEYSEMHERVSKIAELVDIQSHINSSPFEISGGQKQRTSLAGVLVDNVEILLFDEPLANLDPKTGKTAIELIDQIHKETGATVIIIEHRLEDVLHRPADRIILVDDGRIIADMTPDKIMASSYLNEHGIREPLYLTALKYAGVSVTEDLHAAYIDTLDINKVKDKVSAWYNAGTPPQPESEQQVLLEVENVSFSYDGVHQALSGISFSVNAGEMIAIAGKNGAGKSTIAKLICGFEPVDAGVIRYNGDDIKDLSIKERAGLIGYVMQNPNEMISETQIFDEVALGLRNRGADEAEIKEKVTQALKICGLSPFTGWPVSALSFGQKKRVTIASILTLDPKIIILDEPTAGQDYRHYTEIMDFLESLNKHGVTIILITHDMHLLLEYTTRTVAFADGRVIADDKSYKVLSNETIMDQAMLKKTSLYTLADKAGIESPEDFTRHFIEYERSKVRYEK